MTMHLITIIISLYYINIRNFTFYFIITFLQGRNKRGAYAPAPSAKIKKSQIFEKKNINKKN